MHISRGLKEISYSFIGKYEQLFLTKKDKASAKVKCRNNRNQNWWTFS